MLFFALVMSNKYCIIVPISHDIMQVIPPLSLKYLTSLVVISDWTHSSRLLLSTQVSIRTPFSSFRVHQPLLRAHQPLVLHAHHPRHSVLINFGTMHSCYLTLSSLSTQYYYGAPCSPTYDRYCVYSCSLPSCSPPCSNTGRPFICSSH